jgi:hypothetical protein
VPSLTGLGFVPLPASQHSRAGLMNAAAARLKHGLFHREGQD